MTENKLPLLVEKAFLEAIEKRNLDRSAIVLKEVCDTNTELFGKPASDLRRKIQFRWKSLKKRTIRSYSQHLDRFGISHGTETARLLRTQDESPSPETVPDVDEDDNDPDYDPGEDEDDRDDDEN